MTLTILLAATALGGFSGSIELPEAEVTFSPMLYSPWSKCHSFEAAFVKPAESGHDFLFIPDKDKPDVILKGRAVLKGADGAVTGSWRMAIPLAAKSSAALVGAFFLPRYDDAVFEAETKRRTSTN